MKFVKFFAVILLAFLAINAIILVFQNKSQEKLVIFHAGSLSVPIAEIGKDFKKVRGVEIQSEASGSVEAIRKVTELGKKADIIAVSDYSLIEKMLIPDYADFCILFARNEIVLAYSEGSKYSEEISSSNWFDILQRDVKFGFSDPNADPCGYRALMTIKLAEAYYGKRVFKELIEANSNIRSNESTVFVPERIQTNEKIVLRPKEADLNALVQIKAVDYIFTYKSLAKSHGLSFIELPAEINLGNYEKASYYALVGAIVKNETIKGEPIVYGVTVLKDAPNKKLAFEFLALMLGDSGREAFERNYHETMPPKVFGISPEELRGVLE